MKKMIIRAAFAVCVLGLFSSCLQTPSLSDEQLGSSFVDSNLNPNIDPTTGLPYVNPPKKDSSEEPKLSSGSSPSSSGKAPSKVVNKSGVAPGSSGSAPGSELDQDEIEKQNAKDMALYQEMLKKQAEEKEASNSSGSAPQSSGSGLAPAKQAPSQAKQKG